MKRKKRHAKKTTDQYIQELHLSNPYILVLEEYINARTKILHRCLLHNIEWQAYPDNVLRGHGCPECCKEKISIKNGKSNNGYIQELHELFPYIYPQEEYKGMSVSIKHLCLNCGNIWIVSPNSVLHSVYGCPNCAKQHYGLYNKFFEADYKKKLFEINSSIALIGIYTNSQVKTEHKCLICNHHWLAIPNNILRGHGCPNCKSKKLSELFRKSHNEYINQLDELDSQLRPIEDYISGDTPITHKCLNCDHEFSIIPTYVLRGALCPNCGLRSKGETLIKTFLDEHHIDYIPQKKYKNLTGINGYPLSYDFYLPYYNKLIEFNGLQHYQPIDYFGGEESFLIQQEHDKRKKEYALDNNIDLYIIHYKDKKRINELLIDYLNLETLETAVVA